MRSDPINGSIALAGGSGLASGGFLRARLGLVCGLAGHGVGFGFILAGYEQDLRRQTSDVGPRDLERTAEVRGLESAVPVSPTGTKTKECKCFGRNHMGCADARCYNRSKSSKFLGQVDLPLRALQGERLLVRRDFIDED